jgi:hypothetical protein
VDKMRKISNAIYIMDITTQIQQQNELVQNILRNLENYKEVVEEIKKQNEVTKNIIKEQIFKHQGYIEEFQLRITELENENNQTKINDYNNRIDAYQKFIIKKQKILDEYTTKQDNEYEVTIQHIEQLNSLGPVTISDYQDDKLSENIEKYVKIINSVNDFYKENFTTPLDKKGMEIDVGAFKINNAFILSELKTEGVDIGLWEGRQEITISPRDGSKSKPTPRQNVVTTLGGKGRFKKINAHTKRFLLKSSHKRSSLNNKRRKKRTTKRNGRRKKN